MHSGPQGDANARIVIRGDPLASSVRWEFSSDVTRGQGFFSGWLGRYFGVFLKRWVATELETGLLALKAYAETLPVADFSRAEISRLDAPAVTIAMVEFVADQEPGNLAQALSAGFEDISDWALATGAQLGGQPMVITQTSRGGQGRFAAAIPLLEGPRFATPEESPVRVGEAPQGDAVRIVHRGAYADSWRSREQLEAWVGAHGYEVATTSWEHYLTDPASTSEGDLVTHIYFLLEPDPSGAASVAAKRLLQGPGFDGWSTRSLSPARN
jgi:effector-binding domain-containing protein